ncbi:MAG: hypothetical protein CM15mP32_5180 [Flavobacteriaceae bacterium]|nr:MAG: hypothetical protein CM15mP32_5180 [Flavobacteriaceae bacterium]
MGHQRKIIEPACGCIARGRTQKLCCSLCHGNVFYEKDNPAKDFEVEAKKYLEKGFKAIKMKVGLGVERDVANVKHLRSIIGDDIKLMIDSNHAYT